MSLNKRRRNTSVVLAFCFEFNDDVGKSDIGWILRRIYRMVRKRSFDVFSRENSRDKPTVRRLANALKARRVSVWLDEWELPPGQPWQEELERIIWRKVRRGAGGQGRHRSVA